MLLEVNKARNNRRCIGAGKFVTSCENHSHKFIRPCFPELSDKNFLEPLTDLIFSAATIRMS